MRACSRWCRRETRPAKPLTSALRRRSTSRPRPSRPTGDANGAVDDFLRIASSAPNASIRVNAEYDAGALLLREKQWPRAIEVLEAFRRDHGTHALAADVPRRLAGAYVEAGRPLEAAVELERISGYRDGIRRGTPPGARAGGGPE